MHVNRQMTTGLVTLRDAKEIAALPGTSVHMAMAEFGSAEPIRAGHLAVRRVEPRAAHCITGRRCGSSSGRRVSATRAAARQRTPGVLHIEKRRREIG